MSSSASKTPPPGGDQNEGYRLYITILVTVLFAFVTVTLREFCRARIMKRFGWDDGFLIIALVSAPRDIDHVPP